MRTQTLIRAAVGGLLGGMLLGGLFLVWSGIQPLLFPVNCSGLDAEECFLRREIARALTRSQLLAGLTLASGALVCLLWLRQEDRRRRSRLRD